MTLAILTQKNRVSDSVSVCIVFRATMNREGGAFVELYSM